MSTRSPTYTKRTKTMYAKTSDLINFQMNLKLLFEFRFSKCHASLPWGTDIKPIYWITQNKEGIESFLWWILISIGAHLDNLHKNQIVPLMNYLLIVDIYNIVCSISCSTCPHLRVYCRNYFVLGELHPTGQSLLVHDKAPLFPWVAGCLP